MIKLTRQYAVWADNHSEPVNIDGYPAIYDSRAEANTAREGLIRAGDTRRLVVRLYVEHHAGSVFPGGIDLHFPTK